MEARPYQQEAHAAIVSQWDEYQRLLLVMATGTGKTIVFCQLAEHLVREGGRVLILAHRDELIRQAADKLEAATSLKAAIEKANEYAVDTWYPITVGSVQTMTRDKRLFPYETDAFTHIIIDEAHRTLAKTYQKILEYFGGAKVLGVTATPDRGDQKNLGRFYDSIAYEYGISKAVKEGFLCPIVNRTIPLTLDMGTVKQSGGDLAAGDVAAKLEPYLEEIADAIATIDRKRIVVFLPLIAISEQLCALLEERGMKAAEVNGMSKDRNQKLKDFNRGRYQVLCNAMLLTEGWDEPAVDCIVVLRPTRVRALYCQMVGRGTRLHPGKENLLLLDFIWNIDRHELIRPAYLIAEDEDVAREATRMAEELAKQGMPADIQELVAGAENQVLDQRKEALAEEIKKQRRKKSRLVDPLLLGAAFGESRIIEPRTRAEAATESQQMALEHEGVNPEGIGHEQAQTMLNTLAARRAEGLAQPKQIRLLERYGYKDAAAMSWGDAGKAINKIKANGWRHR